MKGLRLEVALGVVISLQEKAQHDRELARAFIGDDARAEIMKLAIDYGQQAPRSLLIQRNETSPL